MQKLHFLPKTLAPPGIELSEQAAQETLVFLTVGEVPAPAQHQRLIQRGLEAAMPLLDITILVRASCLRLASLHPIVIQQSLVTLRELVRMPGLPPRDTIAAMRIPRVRFSVVSFIVLVNVATVHP